MSLLTAARPADVGTKTSRVALETQALAERGPVGDVGEHRVRRRQTFRVVGGARPQ